MHAAWLLLFFVLGASSVARAQEDPERLVDEGVALREARRDADALELFERAHAIAPSARTLAQIALAEQALGRLVAAEQHLREALADEDDRFVRRNRSLLSAALRDIDSALGTLEVRGGVEGARARAGERELGTLPLAPVRVLAGSVELEVTAEGYAPWRTTLDVEAGQTVAADVQLEPIAAREPGPAIPPEPEPPPSAGPSWMLVAGIAALGVGVVGVGVGTGLMIVREENAQARQSCGDDDPACRARFGAAVDAETAGVASYVIGGALAAAGGALLIIGLFDGSPEPGALACGPGPGELGLACRARF